MEKIIGLLLGYSSESYFPDTRNELAIDYGSESLILMFETKRNPHR
jgi:hypothetical protein